MRKAMLLAAGLLVATIRRPRRRFRCRPSAHRRGNALHRSGRNHDCYATKIYYTPERFRVELALRAARVAALYDLERKTLTTIISTRGSMSSSRRSDHVIAVTPGVGVAVSSSAPVESHNGPHPSSAFPNAPVTRRIDQPVDHARERLWRIVLQNPRISASVGGSPVRS